ncbi:Hypp6894 [Branchiostoma lanceolatum]|uniref:Hypp6894 protein n=1 Tax=Branchiostoma lanceolatum TaxID=7740 RepID=A0A8J9YVX0_BRALA|nr:Hypp6894 [Branchiostoma lanceolatum]
MHSMAYEIESQERAAKAEDVIQPEMGRGHSNYQEARNNVLIRARHEKRMKVQTTGEVLVEAETSNAAKGQHSRAGKKSPGVLPQSPSNREVPDKGAAVKIKEGSRVTLDDHSDCAPISRCRQDEAYTPSRTVITNPIAEKLLMDFIHKTVVYKNPDNYIYAKDTHYCESFNNAVLMHLDKRVCYQKDSYIMRMNLGILDWNGHVDRGATDRSSVLVTSDVTLSCQHPNMRMLYNRMVVIPAHTADSAVSAKFSSLSISQIDYLPPKGHPHGLLLPALNWEGKEVRLGQLVAVTYSHPRRFFVGQVVQVGEEQTDEGVEAEKLQSLDCECFAMMFDGGRKVGVWSAQTSIAQDFFGGLSNNIELNFQAAVRARKPQTSGTDEENDVDRLNAAALDKKVRQSLNGIAAGGGKPERLRVQLQEKDQRILALEARPDDNINVDEPPRKKARQSMYDPKFPCSTLAPSTIRGKKADLRKKYLKESFKKLPDNVMRVDGRDGNASYRSVKGIIEQHLMMPEDRDLL